VGYKNVNKIRYYVQDHRFTFDWQSLVIIRKKMNI